MPPELKILGVWVVGLLLLARPSGAVGQDAAASTPNQPRVRAWTDRSGEHQTEASLVNSQDGKVTLKKRDGTTITVSLESLSDADREYVKHHTPGGDRASEPIEEAGPAARPEQRGPSSRPGRSGNVAEINLSGGKKSGSAALPEAKEVIVTGVGTDPEKAMQNAFSQAIEQTVGLLVDAETVVKNDQLIRDEVLTYSRGYMEKYEVVKRWQEDGLHHATIRAVVARDKLVEKLRGLKIAVEDVSGDLAGRQIEFDSKNEEQAAAMFKKALADFDMTKLTKVEIVGEPEITREGDAGTLHIKTKITPDLAAWQQFAKGLRQVVDRTAAARAVVTIESGWDVKADNRGGLARQLKSEREGILVGLFLNVGRSKLSQWEVFRVPHAIEASIKDSAYKGYHLRCELLDEKGSKLQEITKPVAYRIIRDERLTPIATFHAITSPWWNIWLVGPIWHTNDRICVPIYQTEMTALLSIEDLRKVSKTVVFLEEDSTHGKHSGPIRRSPALRQSFGRRQSAPETQRIT